MPQNDRKKIMKVNVLGVNIDDVQINEAIDLVKSWLKGREKHYIVTPNPEFVVKAQNDPEFKKVLNEADLAVPDGVGLNWFGGVKNRVPGVDLMEDLVKLGADFGFTVGFLGGSEGIAEKTAVILKAKYPKLKVALTISGLTVNTKGEIVDEAKLSFSKSDLLFVAFGHGKQEKWIAQNLSKIPVKVAMGVGGSFNYLSGEVPRAPKWIRNLGLEWLFRLATQPWRARRQLVLIQFVVLALEKKFRSMLH